jgi:hypothetical protein
VAGAAGAGICSTDGVGNEASGRWKPRAPFMAPAAARRAPVRSNMSAGRSTWRSTPLLRAKRCERGPRAERSACASTDRSAVHAPEPRSGARRCDFVLASSSGVLRVRNWMGSAAGDRAIRSSTSMPGITFGREYSKPRMVWPPWSPTMTHLQVPGALRSALVRDVLGTRARDGPRCVQYGAAHFAR